MNDDIKGISQQLASHPRWRWEAGMRDADTGLRCMEAGSEEAATFAAPSSQSRWAEAATSTNAHPDLDDPATQGCLMAMLLRVMPFVRYESLFHITWDHGETLGEALARRILRHWKAADA